MSSEVQESLNNFKVIVAFNRVDYFRWKFNTANEKNFAASISAGFANNIFMPLYGLASPARAADRGRLRDLSDRSRSNVTVGLLIGFLLYVNNFYGPMRQLATVWSSFQLAMAGLDRISEVLALESNMPVIAAPAGGIRIACSRSARSGSNIPAARKCCATSASSWRRGKAYALVGPTGGGKTTTASLMARLYDPTQGSVLLHGRDIRSYTPDERAQKIGFILQDPFLFSGTVRDNIVYGNEPYREYSSRNWPRFWRRRISRPWSRVSPKGWIRWSRPAATASAWARSSSSRSCAPRCEGRNC